MKGCEEIVSAGCGPGLSVLVKRCLRVCVCETSVSASITSERRSVGYKPNAMHLSLPR